jgi:hypothetical protein
MAKGAPGAARNRGKAQMATGKPPFGGPKGSGGLAKPKPAGGKAAKPPITGPLSGFRGKGDKLK